LNLDIGNMEVSTVAGATTRGRFVWYDLMTDDPKAAEAFYTTLMGWGAEPWAGSVPPYTMWTSGASPIGGVMALPEEARAGGAPPHWLAYVRVGDVAASAGRVRELGGAVHHGPTEISGAGSFAIVADAQGAVFALYQSAEEHPSESAAPEVGRFSWHELATTDHEAALGFYGELFGWQAQESIDMGEAGTYRLYGLDGPPLGGMFNKPAEMPGPPMWIYYARVADLDAAVSMVSELGGRVVSGPTEVPGGDRIAQCLDPQGALFALHEVAGR
jgi:predicted enzyme related to lactoylglutathione lyase